MNLLKNKNNIKSEQNQLIIYKTETKELLSYVEKNLFHILLKIVKEFQLRIFPKTRLADIIEIKENNELKKKTFGLHIDFTITNYRYKPILLIELDDSTHLYNKQTIENDKLKDEICRKANLPLYRIKTNNKLAYNKDKLEKEILNRIKSFN